MESISNIDGAAVRAEAMPPIAAPIAAHPRPDAPSPRFPAAEVEKLRRMLESHCGLNWSATKEFYLMSRVARRMKETGATTLAEYIYLLFERGDAELHPLVNLLTVNETYFFRHPEQFELLRGLISERLEKSKPEGLSIWSAGCSTGAEPYSLALLLKDSAERAGTRLRITATDIDTEVIGVARAGHYSRRCVTAQASFDIRQRYFAPTTDGGFKLNDEIRNMVHFRQHNLQSNMYPVDVDVIFCRNVFIYFNDENRRKVLMNFYDALKEDGLLFLSPVESLMEVSAFFQEVRGTNGIKCYRKWTTDRRRRCEDGAVVWNRRASLESQSNPVVTRDGRHLSIAGIIEGEERVRIVSGELTFALTKMASEGIRRFFLDMNGIRFISNAGLDEILAQLRRGIKYHCLPERIFVRDNYMLNALLTAGFRNMAEVVIGAAQSQSLENRQDAKVLLGALGPVPPPTAPRPLAPLPRPAAAATGCEQSITFGDIPDEESARRAGDQLIALRRQGGNRAAGAMPTRFVIDMKNTQYADKSYFSILKRFITHWSRDLDVSILCTDYLGIWLQKYHIPDSCICVTESRGAEQA